MNTMFILPAIRVKGVFFVMLVCIAIIALSGCNTDPTKIAIRTNNYEKGKAAIANLTDQDLLVKIAKEAKNFNVRMTAINKLTDQAQLAKFALEDQDNNIRYVAIENLTDQTVLAKIALEDRQLTGGTTSAAIKRLTDYILLAKIAMEDPHQEDREIAMQNLMDTVLFDKIAVEKEDSRVQLIYKLICAFDNVPHEHRTRLISNILPAIRLLFDPEVVNEVGGIISIETDWEERSQYYTGINTSTKGFKPGECFNCSISFQNEDFHLFHSWETSFPTTASDIGFLAADVNAGDLLSTISERLSQASLEKIAFEDKDLNIRYAAIMQLNDTALLVKLALDHEEDNFVSFHAINRLDSLLKFHSRITSIDSIAKIYGK